jgi:hypothetical protein
MRLPSSQIKVSKRIGWAESLERHGLEDVGLFKFDIFLMSSISNLPPADEAALIR